MRAAESPAGLHAKGVVPRFDFRVSCFAMTIPGNRGAAERENQDALVCDLGAGFFAIADGMGGHAAGAVASELALHTVTQFLATSQTRKAVKRYVSDPKLENRRALFQLLEKAVQQANHVLISEGKRNEAWSGMGTTIDLVLLARNRAFVAHVGDSRCYLVRENTTMQVTHDHAMFDSLRTSGKRSRANGAMRSPLSNSVGHRSKITVDIVFVDLNVGDTLLLCTDGAFNGLSNEAAIDRELRAPSVEDACRGLVEKARSEDDRDDATVLGIRIGEPFVERRGDAGPRAQDIETVSRSPLLAELSAAQVLATLAASVEVEIPAEQDVPRAVANDRVAYLVVEGAVQVVGGRVLGPSGLLLARSLLDIATRGSLPRTVERTRLLRIRQDDFTEVCAHDAELAAALFLRLARHVATSA